MATEKQIINYLDHTGWLQTNKTRMGSLVYGRNDYIGTILIPTDKTLADYRELLSRSIGKIAEYEHTSVVALFEKITFFLNDIIRYRAISPYATNGTLPLYAWEKHFDFTVKSVKAAISYADKPHGVSTKSSSKRPANFASKCRIGQTERGSYITKAIIPLNDFQLRIDNELEACDEPYGRKISTSIVECAKIIESAVADIRKKSSTDQLVKLRENNNMAKICERLCIAYEEAVDAFRNKLKISIDLAPSLVLPHIADGLRNTATLSSAYLDEVIEFKNIISRDFSPKRSEITGFIIRLDKDIREDNDQDGKIVLCDSENKKISIFLDSVLYDVAIEAHKTKRPISITGTLTKPKRKYTLIDPINLKIL